MGDTTHQKLNSTLFLCLKTLPAKPKLSMRLVQTSWSQISFVTWCVWNICQKIFCTSTKHPDSAWNFYQKNPWCECGSTKHPDHAELDLPSIWHSMCFSIFPSKPSAAQPNILIMLADDLGWNDLSWHNPRVILLLIIIDIDSTMLMMKVFGKEKR